MKSTFWSFLAVAATAFISQANATQYLVDPTNFTPSKFATINSTIAPGDEVVFGDGVYTPGAGLVVFKGLGTGAEGITIRAAHPGKAIIAGKSTLEIQGSYVTVRDLAWDSCYPQTGSPQYGQMLIFSGASDCRLTECTFVNCGDITSATNGVVIIRDGSQRVRIDHNLFQGSLCVSVYFRVTADATCAAPWHWVDHNYFKAISRLSSDGQEPIQIGQNQMPLGPIEMHVMVESNLWENTTADNELISVKSSSNWVRYNTFRNCISDDPNALSLRGGNDNVAEGNFFLETAGGIHVFGAHQTIINNYFESTSNTLSSKYYTFLDGNPATQPTYSGAINLSAGTGLSPWTSEQAAQYCLIAHNTVVNSTHLTAALYPYTLTRPGVGDGIVLGAQLGRMDTSLQQVGQLYGPLSDFFYNNLVIGSEGVLFRDLTMSGTYSAWPDARSSHFYWSAEDAYPLSSATVGISNPAIASQSGPQPLDESASPYHLIAGTPPQNAGDTSLGIPLDMDGQPRNDGLPDIGADEVSTASIITRPLQAADVGPLWTGRNGSAADSTVIWGPATLTATAQGPTQVALTWTDPTGGASAFEIRYRPSDGFWSTVATVDPGTTSYTVASLAPNTLYSFQVRATESAGSAWSPVESDITGNNYLEMGAQLTVEAEDYAVLYLGSPSYPAWAPTSMIAGYTGLSAMQASSQTGDPAWADAPGMDYRLRFEDAGTYNVWVRYYATDSGSDSFRWGWNGNELSNTTYGEGVTTYNAWTWQFIGTVTVSSSDLSTIQTFNLRRREHGLAIDRIYLTTGTTAPGAINGGNGPAESSFESSPKITGLSSTITPTPVGTTQPTQNQDINMPAGSSVVMSVTATSSPAMTYQWSTYVRPSDPTVPPTVAVISGATTSTYTISSASAANQVGYFVTVTNPIGSATSEIMYLAVQSPPMFTTQPAGTSVPIGGDATFTVATDNAWDRKQLQWQLGGQNIPNATSVTYTVPAAKLSDAGNYTVIATDKYGETSTSNVATLTVTGTPSTPQYWVETGGAVTFEAENYDTLFAGSGSYAPWTASTAVTGYVGASAVQASSDAGDPDWADAPGMDYRVHFQTTGTYNVWMRYYATDTGSDSFRWGWNGTEKSNATYGTGVTTYGAWTWLKVGTVSVATMDLGSPQTLNVRRREHGFTIDRIYLTNTTTSPSDVNSGNGPDQSSRSGDLPVITSQPSDLVATVGSNVTLSVTATNGSSYRWFRNGVELVDTTTLLGTASTSYSGSTGPTLTIGSVPDINQAKSTYGVTGVGGSYTVVVSNAFGSVSSSPFTLLVARAVSTPGDVTVATGTGLILAVTPDLCYNPASFTQNVGYDPAAAVASVQTLTFQWYKDGTAIGGATGASLIIPSAGSTDAGTYYLSVAQGSTAVFSLSAFTVTVQ